MFNKTIVNETHTHNHVPDQITIKEENRCSITLEEYESMKKQIEDLKHALTLEKNLTERLVKPFIIANAPQNIVQDILDGKVESVRAVVKDSPIDCTTELAYIVKVSN